MSGVPAGGFKMGHKGANANKTGRKLVKPIKRTHGRSQRDLVLLATYQAESVNLSLLPREALVDLYLRCVQALASAPADEEIG